MNPALIAQVRRLDGAPQVLVDPDELVAYGYDATMGYRGTPAAVVMAETEAHVVDALATARKQGTPCLARGGATSLSASAVPPDGALVIDTNRMRRITGFDEERQRATVEPGVVTRDFRDYAAARGLFYAPDPSSEAAATIGGNVATNAGGPYAYKYGVTRDAATGLRVATPRHGLLSLTRGTDDGVIDLIIGSEGTLGIVTEVSLQLRPLPSHRSVRAASFPDGESALRVVAQIMESGITPAKLEFLDDITVESLERSRPWGFPRDAGGLLLVELDGEKAEVHEETDALDALLRSAGGGMDSVDPVRAERWWEARRGITASLARIRPAKIGEDICVPYSQLAPTFKAIKQAADDADVVVAIFGHAADGTLHPNMLYDPTDEEERDRAFSLLPIVADAGLAAGGILSGEHGLGRVKQPFIDRAYDPPTLDAMRRIKRAFDPDNIMNPGAMWPTGPMEAHP
ncbi:MAG: FAD-binding protein [Chloroflexota bacterium]|nr:FAD-binding protein [Chloroflexota bacterium]MDE2898078.1 FAD-binding protein [Chloroflexota bacterium]